jgi:hypothetical protein
VMGQQTLPFEKVQHQIATLDAQPSSEQGGILVMVTGALLVWMHIFASGVGLG